MIDCVHKLDNICHIASSLASTSVSVFDEHCEHCVKQSDPKSVNHVTVSIAVYELSKTDKKLAAQLAMKYREHLTRRVEDEYDYPCLNRGQIIGELDCKCQGHKKVYSCNIHTKCAIRKLVPGKPRLIIDQETIEEDIKFCNDCEDIRSE